MLLVSELKACAILADQYGFGAGVLGELQAENSVEAVKDKYLRSAKETYDKHIVKSGE